jgi:TolB-like protein
LTAKLEITLFGTCAIRVTGDAPCEIRGAKHRALISLLATAPLGRRTRTFLQNTLWGYSDYDSGHQNLRRALSDLRKIMGDHFATFFHTTNSDIELNFENVCFLGGANEGPFLYDLNVAQPEFTKWVQDIQANPEQVAALFRTTPAAQNGRPRPRITALPLAVLGDDPQTRVLADWVAEEACRSLSRSNLLTVISHLSSRAMAKQMIDIADVRETLDADFMLTGSLRRQGDDYIVDFDFIDARSGDIIWNRHFVSPVASFTDMLQDNLVNVIQSIGRSVADAAITYVRDREIVDVEDHHLVISGVSLMHRSQMRDFINSRTYLEEATKRMPRAAEAHAWLGKWYVLSVFKGLTTNRDSDTRKALDCTARALDIDPESSFSLTIDGFANNNLLKDMALAETRYNAALNVNPNESLSWLLRGALMAFRDDGAAAIRATETARKLSPIDPFGYYYDSLASTAYCSGEDYVNALDRANSSLAINDRHISTIRVKITALHCLGRDEEAIECAKGLRRRHPEFSVEEYRKTHPSASNRVGQTVIKALIASGLT